MSELDDFIEANIDTPAEEAPAEPVEEVSEVVEEGETTAPEAEAVEEPTEEAKEPEETWTKTAVLDERRKRQALEKELEALKANKEPEERPDLFEDPDGALKHTENSIDQKLLNQKIAMSVEMIKSQHEDYDELETEFIDLVKEHPNLVPEMNNHPMPAKFVRDTALKYRNLQQVDKVPEYQQEIAALKAQLEELQASKTQTVPKSLTGKGSKSEDKATSYGSIDDELADILGR